MTLIVLFLSVFIAAIALPGAWLQLLRVRKERTSEGLSVTFIAMGASAAATWLTYGFMAHESLQIVVNSGGTLAQLLTLGLMVKMAPELRRVCLAVAAYLVVMVTVGFVFGPEPLGTLGALLGFSCRVPQVIKSWNEPGGSAISVPNFVLSAVASFGWFAFGLIHHDMFVMASSSTTIFVSMYVVMRTVRAVVIEEELLIAQAVA